jgi:HK97 family phage portal protein
VRLLDGFGTKGAKAWPFNYHAGVKSFGSWVYRAAMLRAKAVAKVKLRLYVRAPKGVRKARDFKTRSAWRLAMLERLDAQAGGDLRPGDGDGVLMFNTRPVDVRRKRFLAGDVRGGSPGDRVLAKVAEFGADGYEEVTEPHPALQVLSTVNPWMNGFELSILRWVYLLLTGNAYLHPVIDPRSGVPAEVWPMPSQWVSVLPDKDTLIRGYSYGADRATAREFAPDEVIQWRLPNPEDPFFYGKGCVEAAWTALGLHRDKRIMDAAKFQNMARPDWLLVVKGGNGDALNRLEAAVDQKLRGAHNTGRMLAVNGDGVTATALNLPIDEIGDADRVIEEIAAGFEIPVSMLLGNDPVKANSESMVNSFLRDTVLPDTVMDAEKLNERWLPLFGVGDDAVLAYDSPMIDDAELELKRVTQLRQYGIIDGNEAREEEGYGPHADGDALLFAGKPIGDSAVEAASAVAEATAPDPAQAGGNDAAAGEDAEGEGAEPTNYAQTQGQGPNGAPHSVGRTHALAGTRSTERGGPLRVPKRDGQTWRTARTPSRAQEGFRWRVGQDAPDGHWVTINGAHVLIAAGGPADVVPATTISRTTPTAKPPRPTPTT